MLDDHERHEGNQNRGHTEKVYTVTLLIRICFSLRFGLCGDSYKMIH